MKIAKCLIGICVALFVAENAQAGPLAQLVKNGKASIDITGSETEIYWGCDETELPTPSELASVFPGSEVRIGAVDGTLRGVVIHTATESAYLAVVSELKAAGNVDMSGIAINTPFTASNNVTEIQWRPVVARLNRAFIRGDFIIGGRGGSSEEE